MEATAKGAQISGRITHSETTGVDIADFEAAAAHLDLPAKMFYGHVNTSDGRCCRSLKESGGVISPIRTALPPEAAVPASPPSFISLGHLRGFPVPRAIKKMLFSLRRRDIWLLLNTTSVLFGQSQIARKRTNGLDVRVHVVLVFLEIFF